MAHANLLKIYHVLEDELKARPEETKARYPSLTPEGVKAMGGKVKLAIGADGPIGGEKATAAYFVSLIWIHQRIYVIGAD